jgi:methanol--5-hydroxybenzimidazolylcobamide Co-methyltransferase
MDGADATCRDPASRRARPVSKQELDVRCTRLAIPDPDDLVFGRSLHPVDCGFGLSIGNGSVFPEVNFTLPPMSLDDSTWSETLRQYQEMADAMIERALALQAPGLVLELELLPPQTERAEWGTGLTALLSEALRKAHDLHGLPGALRTTVIDLRHSTKRPRLRDGKGWEATFASFEACAGAGAHIMSIESEGGKEVGDEALLAGDVAGIAFALGVLGCRDMAWLWDRFVAVCESASRDSMRVVAGGDSACAFGNTAMQLAGQRMLPQVFAAVVRAMTGPRSLVAFEHGVVGPSKDCAYENVYLKAITGCPISMEGKSAACAHFSLVGNVAGACCDLWSNESVQNVQLLSGSAPAVFTEVLTYDCRLMNEALERGQALCLRDLMVGSDAYRSPQALVLSPESAVAIAEAIVGEEDGYRRTVAAGRKALEIIRGAVAEGKMTLPPAETRWLDRIDAALADLPENEGDLIDRMTPVYGHLFDPAGYGL